MKDKDVVIKNGFVLFYNGWPSNWWTAEFKLERIKFTSTEQYFMWRKAKLFNDRKALEAILATDSPAEQKRIGREVKGYVEALWRQTRYNVMVTANYAKFMQNKDLRQKLLDTHPNRMVEASPVDSIWGIGLGMDHPDATKPSKWQGQNLLGRVLDQVRSTLMEME